MNGIPYYEGRHIVTSRFYRCRQRTNSATERVLSLPWKRSRRKL